LYRHESNKLAEIVKHVTSFESIKL